MIDLAKKQILSPLLTFQKGRSYFRKTKNNILLIGDSEITSCILARLPTEYDYLITPANTCLEPIPLDELCGDLITHELCFEQVGLLFSINILAIPHFWIQIFLLKYNQNFQTQFGRFIFFS